MTPSINRDLPKFQRYLNELKATMTQEEYVRHILQSIKRCEHDIKFWLRMRKKGECKKILLRETRLVIKMIRYCQDELGNDTMTNNVEPQFKC